MIQIYNTHKQLFINCLAKYHEFVISQCGTAAAWIVIQISTSYAWYEIVPNCKNFSYLFLVHFRIEYPNRPT